MWIHASIKCQFHTPQTIHICCHRAAFVSCHFPASILFSAANDFNHTFFHIALDWRLNITSDSNILLLTFLKTSPHNCSPQVIIWSRRVLFPTDQFSTHTILNVSIIWLPTVISFSDSLLPSSKPMSLDGCIFTYLCLPDIPRIQSRTFRFAWLFRQGASCPSRKIFLNPKMGRSSSPLAAFSGRVWDGLS